MKPNRITCALYGQVCPLGSCPDPSPNGECFVDPGNDPDAPYSSEKSSDVEQLLAVDYAVDSENVVHVLDAHDRIFVPRSPLYDTQAFTDYWLDVCYTDWQCYLRSSDWQRWDYCATCRAKDAIGGDVCAGCDAQRVLKSIDTTERNGASYDDPEWNGRYGS